MASEKKPTRKVMSAVKEIPRPELPPIVERNTMTIEIPGHIRARNRSSYGPAFLRPILWMPEIYAVGVTALLYILIVTTCVAVFVNVYNTDSVEDNVWSVCLAISLAVSVASFAAMMGVFSVISQTNRVHRRAIQDQENYIEHYAMKFQNMSDVSWVSKCLSVDNRLREGQSEDPTCQEMTRPDNKIRDVPKRVVVIQGNQDQIQYMLNPQWRHAGRAMTVRRTGGSILGDR